jgi:hypothetical protein
MMKCRKLVKLASTYSQGTKHVEVETSCLVDLVDEISYIQSILLSK